MLPYSKDGAPRAETAPGNPSYALIAGIVALALVAAVLFSDMQLTNDNRIFFAALVALPIAIFLAWGAGHASTEVRRSGLPMKLTGASAIYVVVFAGLIEALAASSQTSRSFTVETHCGVCRESGFIVEGRGVAESFAKAKSIAVGQCIQRGGVDWSCEANAQLVD
ncbi:MAG: hypothetical protein ACFBRM_06705 [Pikeienuella sp.]